MTGERFPKSVRLRRRSEFKRAYDEGRRVVSPYFVGFALASHVGRLRVGVVASRRVGGAVARNRAKRVLREVFRKSRVGKEVSVDLVLVARAAIVRAAFEDVQVAYERFIPRLLRRVDDGG